MTFANVSSLARRSLKPGRKSKTPAVEEVKEASMYQEQFQGASEETIAEILAKKERYEEGDD